MKSMKKWVYTNKQWTQLSRHTRHLPLFTFHSNWTHTLPGLFMLQVMLLIFRLYVRTKVVGDTRQLGKKYPRLLIISNHSSHADTPCIISVLPFNCWSRYYVCAAQDYWFSNPFFAFFAKHSFRAIPINRKAKGHKSIQICSSLLSTLDKIWVILYPEGTRSEDHHMRPFKKGVGFMSTQTQTPILFLYIKDMKNIMPKGQKPRPGKVTVYVGPVQPPDTIDVIQDNYRKWVTSINPYAYGKPSIEL